jgi:hypothetical protein
MGDIPMLSLMLDTLRAQKCGLFLPMMRVWTRSDG